MRKAIQRVPIQILLLYWAMVSLGGGGRERGDNMYTTKIKFTCAPSMYTCMAVNPILILKTNITINTNKYNSFTIVTTLSHCTTVFQNKLKLHYYLSFFFCFGFIFWNLKLKSLVISKLFNSILLKQANENSSQITWNIILGLGTIPSLL